MSVPIPRLVRSNWRHFSKIYPEQIDSFMDFRLLTSVLEIRLYCLSIQEVNRTTLGMPNDI